MATYTQWMQRTWCPIASTVIVTRYFQLRERLETSVRYVLLHTFWIYLVAVVEILCFDAEHWESDHKQNVIIIYKNAVESYYIKSNQQISIGVGNWFMPQKLRVIS